MPRNAQQPEPVDLDALDAFLLSDRAPENAMGLSDLDGFLTAIAIGPETIMPSEWLPVIWGGEDSIFDDLDEAWSVSSLIVARYNDIISSLQIGPEEWASLFWEPAAGEVIVADWAAGFLAALEMIPDAWSPLFEHHEVAVLTVPILLAGGEQDAAEAIGIEPAVATEWLRHAVKYIPMAVPAIDAFWKQHRKHDLLTRSKKRRSRRLRRRALNPYGSGTENRRYRAAA